jgi:hypothetical protein
MTELQIEMRCLQDAIFQATCLLERLKTKKESPKPEFPRWFIAKEDRDVSGTFIVGLKTPFDYKELPVGFVGRAAKSESDIRQLIRGLQILIGEAK